VNEVKVVIGPKIADSFMVRRSYISYYIMQQTNLIKKAVISNDELSDGVFLDLVRYNSMLEHQKNLKMYQYRLKILRRVSRKMKVRDTYRRGRYIRKSLMF
jgi:hypothetical protein